VDIDPEALAASLRRLHDLDNDDVLRALDQTIAACVDLFGVSGSGLMIIDEQHALRDAVASDGPGRVLEKVQSETGQGPCVDTFVHDTVVSTADIGTDSRWPASRALIAEHGVHAVLGVPVHVGGLAVGSLDVYLDRPHDWNDSEIAALLRYGQVVETTLRAAMVAHQAGELADQLQYALDHRVVIERAVGFLMARQGVGAVEAFNVLRRTARSRRRKVADVARELLETGALPH
jgi:GAF domain-containing protein